MFSRPSVGQAVVCRGRVTFSAEFGVDVEGVGAVEVDVVVLPRHSNVLTALAEIGSGADAHRK